MKTRKITKKLSLNKKTVVNLDEKSMKGLRGGTGESVPYSNCEMCVTESCAKTVCQSLCETDCVSLCSDIAACCP